MSEPFSSFGWLIRRRLDTRLFGRLLVLLLVAVGGYPSRSFSASALSGTMDLTGVIVDVAGAPIPGAEAVIYTAHPRIGSSAYCPSCYPDCGKHQTTDSAGRFQFRAVADWLKFRIYAVREGYEPASIPDVDPKDGIARVVLKKYSQGDAGRRVVQGRILDPAGRPVAGATIQPFARKQESGMVLCGVTIGNQPVAITDQQGIYRFHPKNPGQEIYADLSARGLADQRFSISEVAGTTNETRMSVGTTIRGTLLDPAGKTLGDIEMSATWPDESHQCVGIKTITIATDQEGRFSIENAPAHTALSVYARMSSLAPRGLATSTATAVTGENNATLDLVFNASKSAHIVGNMEMEDGSNIPDDAKVSLARGETSDVLFSEVDTHGKFSFDGASAVGGNTIFAIVKGYQIQTSSQLQNNGGLLLGNLRDTGNSNVRVVLVPAAYGIRTPDKQQISILQPPKAPD